MYRRLVNGNSSERTMNSTKVASAIGLLAISIVATASTAETIEYRCNGGTQSTHFIEYSGDGKTATLQSQFGNLASKGYVLTARAAPSAGVDYVNDSGMEVTLRGESRNKVTLAGGRRIFNCEAAK